MSDIFRFADDLGPRLIAHLHDPDSGLKAIVAIDNVARGPGIGGVRMAPDVTAEEAFRLARAMTLKAAAADLPHGGCKAVIAADPAMPSVAKERLIRAFGRAIARFEEFIPGPDMGTNEICMVWLKEEAGRAVGLPADHGGIPLDEIGATGLGVAAAAEIAADHIGLDLRGARVAVQGFGAVGLHAAQFLARRGAVIVGVADISAALHQPGGIDLKSLVAHVDDGGLLMNFAAGTVDRDEIVGFPRDIWVPAARPDVVTKANVDRLDTKIIVQGANIPVSEEAETVLHDRGVVSIPDFIANAGGLICGCVELQGGSVDDALAQVVDKIATNTHTVLDRAAADGVTPRAAGVALALDRIRAASRSQRAAAQ